MMTPEGAKNVFTSKNLSDIIRPVREIGVSLRYPEDQDRIHMGA
jgi:hypothetical protein